MHPLSDKDLDRLSREAAEQNDVEQNTSGWDKLEQKLNKHLPEAGKKERRRFLFFIWLFALISGGGLFWMLTSDNDPRLITLKQGSSRGTLPASKNAEEDRSSLYKNGNSATPNAITATEDKKTLSDFQVKSKNPEGMEKTAPTVIIPEPKVIENTRAARLRKTDLQRSSNDLFANDAGKVNRKKNKNAVSPHSPGVQLPLVVTKTPHHQGPTTNAEKQVSDISVADEPSSATQNNNPDNNKLTADTAKSFIIEQSQTATSDSASVAKRIDTSKSKDGFKKGWQVGLAGGPDMSNVKFSSTDKVGFNVGIQVGYRLSQRWSLNTGVLYTKKNYTATGEDFNPPKGTWLDNVTLNEVEGNCFMFDIPLNVRYDLNTGASHRYFVSTGLSTYFMKKENYEYYYQYTNGSASSRYRTYASSDRYWFSILNLSAGFEKKLSNKFSLQAEPYLKIPLQGVGYGNIQLNSYGVYFALKFHANKR